jgi:hypothetical protein
MNSMKALWRYVFGGRQAGFNFGYCAWCEHYELIVPGEVLCEEHWLETK